jgi:putative ABC transport system ATP-binding protein
VYLAGELLSRLDEDGRARLRANRVGFVFQSFHLVAALTALENVMLPLELAGRADAFAAASDILARVGLAARLHHYPRQLSGGEQQRVALARASVGRPMVLFADEPTGNLDTVTGERIAELLFELNRGSETTLVLVTHDRMLAQRCRRSLWMEAGALREAGGPQRAAIAGAHPAQGGHA